VPAKWKPDQEAVDELVKGYLLERVSEQAGADRELFDSVMALHELAEANEPTHEPAERLEGLRDSPAIKAAMVFLGGRVQRLIDVGVKIAKDTKALRVRLRDHLGEKGIDPANPKQRVAAVAEYERVLAATIPLDIALTNVEALADMVELANDVLNQRGLKRHAYELAWQAGRRAIFKDPKVLAQMEQLKSDIQRDPPRLQRVEKLIREIGPEVVKDAYRRGLELESPKAKAKPAPASARKATAKPASAGSRRKS
jgi:hypothetical protein